LVRIVVVVLGVDNNACNMHEAFSERQRQDPNKEWLLFVTRNLNDFSEVHGLIVCW